MNTEESTPLTDNPDETSVAANAADTAAETAPATPAAEPEGQIAKAEENGTEKLLAGKFKTVEELEKSYKEAEKSFHEAAAYKKKLEAYEAAEAKAREVREAEARSNGYPDAASRQIENDVAVNEFNLYVQALETKLDGDNYAQAAKMLQAYQQTGRRAYLEAAQKYFPPEVISQIAVANAHYAGERQQEYATARLAEQQQLLNGIVRDFCEKNTDWIDGHEERQQLIGESIKALGADINLEALKSFIEAIEKRAVEDFKKDLARKQETNEQLSRIQAPSSDGSGKQTDFDVERWQDVEDPVKLREMLRKV